MILIINKKTIQNRIKESLSSFGNSSVNFRNKERRSYVHLFNLENECALEKSYESNYSPISYPHPNIKIDIVALCSVIHVPSVAALCYSMNSLMGSGIDIEMQFHKNSREVLQQVGRYNEIKQPLLLMASDGTARELDNNPGIYKCRKAVEVVPGYLRWTSSFSSIDTSKATFKAFDHPTDRMALLDFNRLLFSSSEDNTSATLSPRINFIPNMPEGPDMYLSGNRNNLFLTVDFLDNIAGMKCTHTGWKFIQHRYIYFNEYLIESYYAEKGRTRKFSHWLQRLIIDSMRELTGGLYSCVWNHLPANQNFCNSLDQYFNH